MDLLKTAKIILFSNGNLKKLRKIGNFSPGRQLVWDPLLPGISVSIL